MKNPLVSVVMSVYNGEEYLERAIGSVMEQTYQNWELIAINDCSTDSSLAIMERLAAKDPRIRVVCNEQNSRLPTSLNRGVALAQGKYIARMDADDICLPDRLEKQVAFMEANPDADVSSCRFLTLKNKTLASGGTGGKSDQESVRTLLIFTNPILHPGIIAKAEVLKENPYDTTLTCTEDLELWSRLVQAGKKVVIQEAYLMIYRLHDKQITATTRERQEKEVLGIQSVYYSRYLQVMTPEEEAFYIPGVYFREVRSVPKLNAFYRSILRANKKTRAFEKEALYYAMFEILAEYNRKGISKKELFRGLLFFPLSFLARELRDRKLRSAKDSKRCIELGKKLGFSHIPGTEECPVFEGECDW